LRQQAEVERDLGHLLHGAQAVAGIAASQRRNLPASQAVAPPASSTPTSAGAAPAAAARAGEQRGNSQRTADSRPVSGRDFEESSSRA
jgi:hypothetical protein